MGVTLFPTDLDDWADEGDGDTIEEDNINNVQAAVEALEDKVGITSSAVVTSHDYLLTHLPAQSGDWDAGAIEIRAQTFESDVVTGTAPLVIASTTVCTNLNADTVDGKDVDGSDGAGEITTNDGTQTLTNKTLTSPVIGTGITLPANSIDAITEIAAALKTGSDAKLVTGTAGTTNYVPKWDANGDIIDGYEASTDGTMDGNSDSALPTEKAVVTYVSSKAGFGAWTTDQAPVGGASAPYAKDAVYLAATDGFVVLTTQSASSGVNFNGYTDSSNPPTTIRITTQRPDLSGTDVTSGMFPVKKGDYWKVTCSVGTVVIYWMPLGA